MLTAHIANWLGIIYFDQTYLLWFIQLAAISTLTGSIQKSEMFESEADSANEDNSDRFRHLSAKA